MGLALEAVHGRDRKFWYDFGGVPLLLPDRKRRDFETREFGNAYWPRGRVFAAEPILESLRKLDHLALETAVRANKQLLNEFRDMFKVQELKSEYAKRVQRSLGAIVEWLEISIKPLL